MLKVISRILLMIILLALTSPAFAYVGPGAGISVLGSLLGILATIFVAIGAILFWPLRKYLKRRKLRRSSMAGKEVAGESCTDTGDDGMRDET